MTRLAVLAASLCLATGAAAHEAECNNRPVPAQIKASCCGKADHHFVPEAAISHESGVWVVTVDRWTFRIPDDHAQPADDGCYHIFFSDTITDGAGMPRVWCWQVPMDL